MAYYACAQRTGQAGCSHQYGFLGWVDYPRPDRNPVNNPIYTTYDDVAPQPEEEQGIASKAILLRSNANPNGVMRL